MMDGTRQESFTVRFGYDRALMRRAMTGWWQSVVPPEPFLKRAIFWAVVWFAIGVAALMVQAAGISLWLIGGGLFGAALMVGAFGYLQRTRMERFWDVIGTHWDRAGETSVTFSPEGLVIADGVSRRDLSWAAVDAVKAVRGGTVFRSGISMLVVPDKALPEGTTASAFREHVAQWKGAA